jgi:hypothetical protein
MIIDMITWKTKTNYVATLPIAENTKEYFCSLP